MLEANEVSEHLDARCLQRRFAVHTPFQMANIHHAGNLTTPDGVLAPAEMVARVGIGSRVRMVFTDITDGLALPQWTIDEAAVQLEPWRYPQE